MEATIKLRNQGKKIVEIKSAIQAHPGLPRLSGMRLPWTAHGFPGSGWRRVGGASMVRACQGGLAPRGMLRSPGRPLELWTAGSGL
jgi:hypothetical protein